MVIATPGGPVEARAIAKFSVEYEVPMYIRLGKAGEKVVYTEESIKLDLGDIFLYIRREVTRLLLLRAVTS